MRSHRPSSSRPVALVLSVSLLAAAGFALPACGPEPSHPSDPPKTNEDAGAGNLPDAAALPADAFQPSTILVNGLVDDALTDVRICLPGDGVALPGERSLALANYPGLARGRGVDLGQVAVTGLDVFAASALKSYPTTTTCQLLRDQVPFTHVDAEGTATGPTALVLLDDTKGSLSLKRITLQAGLPPTVDRVAGQFAFASAGVTSAKLTMTFDAVKAQTDTASSSNGFLLPAQYEGTITVSDGASFSYQQSLRSVQHVSDPTTDPVTFYDVRTQYLFILLGDVKEPYVAWKSPEAITGKELHIAAVPFTLTPKGSR